MRKHLRKLALLSLFIMSMTFLYGCQPDGPSGAVETFLKEVKKGDKADPKIVGDVLKGTLRSINAEENAAEGTMSPEVTQKLSEVVKNLEYKINSENIQGDKATVNVTVTRPDIGSVIVTSIQKVLSLTYSDSVSGNPRSDTEIEKLYNESLLESLDEVKYTDQVGDIDLEKKNDEWVIINTDKLTKLLFNIDLETYNQMQTPQNNQSKPNKTNKDSNINTNTNTNTNIKN